MVWRRGFAHSAKEILEESVNCETNTDRDVLTPRFADGAIAQLGERLNGIQEVRGSTPLGSTNKINDLGNFPLALPNKNTLDLLVEGASF